MRSLWTILRWAGCAAVVCALDGCPTQQSGDAGYPWDVLDVHRYRDGGPPDVIFFVDATPDAVAPGIDAAIDTAPPDVMPSGTAHLRLANVLAPDMTSMAPPPNVDLCLRASSSTSMAFIGPLLANGPLAPGVAWNEVSAYIPITTGRYDVVFVAGGSTDCNAPILPGANLSNVDFTTLNGYATVVLSGVATTPADAGAAMFPPSAVVLTDHDPSTATGAPQPLIRLFNAAPTPLFFDVGLVIGTTFDPVFDDVGIGELGHPDPLLANSFDSLGYYEAAPLSPVSVGARVSCTLSHSCTTCAPPVIVVNGLSISAGTYTTAILVVAFNTTTSMVQTAALMCVDSVVLPSGGLSACQVFFPS